MMVSIEQPDSVDIGIENVEDVIPQARRNVSTLKIRKFSVIILTISWLAYTCDDLFQILILLSLNIR